MVQMHKEERSCFGHICRTVQSCFKPNSSGSAKKKQKFRDRQISETTLPILSAGELDKDRTCVETPISAEPPLNDHETNKALQMLFYYYTGGGGFFG